MDETFSFPWDNPDNVIQDEIIIGENETTEINLNENSDLQVINIFSQNAEAPDISSEQVLYEDDFSTFTNGNQISEEVVIGEWEGNCAEEVVGNDQKMLEAAEIPLPMNQDVHIASKPYPCDFCNRRFKKKENLINHMAAHQRSHRYLECNVCGVRFIKNSDLVNHQKIHEYTVEPEFSPKFSIVGHKNTFVCQLCGVGFAREKALISHIRIHEGDSPFACKQCNKTFWDMRSMEEHWQTVHTKDNKPYLNKDNQYNSYSCNICGMSFCRQNDLTRHQLNHDDENIGYLCTNCGESFSDANELSSHKEEMHGEVYEYQCMLCGDTFADEDSRIAHLRQQHPEHEIIEYRTKTKTRKTRRPRQQGYSYDEDCSDKPNQNKSDQPFSCQECGKRFTTRSSQQIHMRIHTGERPYACSYCHKAFADGGTLRKHERIHTGEKPYACVICPKAFNQRVVLREHIRAHHSGPNQNCVNSMTPYSCSVCLDEFSESQDLIVHLIHHCDTNTAMKRPPRIGPRKYMRRSKLKSQEYDIQYPEIQEDQSDEEVPPLQPGESPRYEIDMDTRWTNKMNMNSTKKQELDFHETYIDQEMSTSSTSTPTYLEQNLMESREQAKNNSGISRAKMIHTEKKPKIFEPYEINRKRQRNTFTRSYEEFRSTKRDKPRTKNVSRTEGPIRYPVATFSEEVTAVNNLLKLNPENNEEFYNYQFQTPEPEMETTVDYNDQNNSDPLQENERNPTRKSSRKTKGLSGRSHIDDYSEEFETQSKKEKKIRKTREPSQRQYEKYEGQSEHERTDIQKDSSKENRATRKSSRTKRTNKRYNDEYTETAEEPIVKNEPKESEISIKEEYEQCEEEQVVYETPEDYVIVNGPEVVSQSETQQTQVNEKISVKQEIIDPLLEFAEISMQHARSDYKCEMCSSVFLLRSQLLAHVRVHI